MDFVHRRSHTNPLIFEMYKSALDQQFALASFQKFLPDPEIEPLTEQVDEQFEAEIIELEVDNEPGLGVDEIVLNFNDTKQHAYVFEGDWTISRDDAVQPSGLIESLLGKRADIKDSQYAAFLEELPDDTVSGKCRVILQIASKTNLDSLYSLFEDLSEQPDLANEALQVRVNEAVTGF